MVLSGNNVHKDYTENRGHHKDNIVNPPLMKTWAILKSSKTDNQDWQQLSQDLFSLKCKEWGTGRNCLTDFCNVIVDWDKSNDPPVGIRRVVHMDTFSLIEENFYVGNNVGDFLNENRFLSSLLIEVRDEILKFFPNSNLYLEVVNDPEIDNNSQLLLSIANNLDPEVAINKLYEFDQKWWLDNMLLAKGKLCIDVMFV